MMQVSFRVHQYKSNILNDPEVIEIYKLAATIAGQQLKRATPSQPDSTAAEGPKEKSLQAPIMGEFRPHPSATGGTSMTAEERNTNWTERKGTIYEDGKETGSEPRFGYKIEDLGDDLERVLEELLTQ